MENQEQPLTKKQRRELRKQEKLANRQKQASQKQTNRILLWAVVIIVVGGIIFLVMQFGGNSTPPVLTNAVSDSDWAKGNAEAGVTLIEYSDFQCPACRTYYNTVKQLVEEYGDQVQFVYRHFPLRSIHANAQLAAQASEAAGLQDKFWEMHDLLFENQAAWSNESDPADKFAEYATALELDVDKFKTDLYVDSVKDKVNSNYNGATASNINSTPTFFLNGEKIKTPSDLDGFKQLIREALGGEETATE